MPHYTNWGGTSYSDEGELEGNVNEDINLEILEWTKLLGSTESDGAEALTTGLDGSIYIAGRTFSDLDGETNSGGLDAFIAKYNPDGTKDWTRLLGSTGHDSAMDLSTGIDGSIYITGNTFGNLDGETNSGGVGLLEGSDSFIAKYNPDGTKEWTKLSGSTYYDGAESLTTGLDGSIYITGHAYTEPNSDGSDSFISKYNPDGTIGIKDDKNNDDFDDLIVSFDLQSL